MNAMSRKKVYFENLDAIRSLAFLMVLIWHLHGYLAPHLGSGFVLDIVRNGHLGVNLFFVLSGFLITYLLLVEKETTGKIQLWYFYMRRLLRIWPLYFLVVVLSMILIPMATHHFNLSLFKDHIWWYLSFTQNFDRIYSGFSGIGNDMPGVLWSIAVEEQFYLFWPLIILFLPRKSLSFVLSLILVLSLLFRYLNSESETVLYLHTFSVMSDLAIGALLAISSLNGKVFHHVMVNLSARQIVLLYLLFIAIFLSYQKWYSLNTFNLVFERFMISLFFAFFIAEQCFSVHSPLKLGRLPFLGKIGLISYGLYCTHLLSIMLFQKINIALNLFPLSSGLFLLESVLCLGFSVLMAFLIYRFYEKKFLAMRKSFTIIETRKE